MEPQQLTISLDLQQLITTEQAWHYNVVPKFADHLQLGLYIDKQTFNSNVTEELEMLLGKQLQFFPIESRLIQQALGTYYRKNTELQANRKKEFINSQSDDFLQHLIMEAKNLGSSDIHIEVYEDKARIRFRIDGLLIERYSISKSDYPALINKIKIKANLDIAEKRLPQDGRIFINTDGTKFDIRVSILPSLYGEKIVLRLLSNDAADIDIKKLGFSEAELTTYLTGIKKPHGIILISGPTGSGKTTSLYATLKLLNKSTSNILTIEDPIEYTLDGINQVQLKETIGLTFAAALRTFLRQDPDVIMLGEVRDPETAQMAIRAALTGHLVLSTIHTNSAWGTVSRLIDMGVPPFLVGSTLTMSVAQRLVRLLCNTCKQTAAFDPALYPPAFQPPHLLEQHCVAKGCEQCYYTGYKGRKAIYEVITLDNELIENIKSNNHNVAELLKQRNIKSLADNAFQLLKNGVTTIDEVYPILLNNY